MELPSQNRVLELVKSFKMKDCWVACVDAQGGRSVELAKALLPQVRLLVAIDGASVGADLKKVEEMVWKQQRRKLLARPSETTSQLARLAATLPPAPVLSVEPKTEFENLVRLEPSEEPKEMGRWRSQRRKPCCLMV